MARVGRGVARSMDNALPVTVTITRVAASNFEVELRDTGHKGYGSTVHEALRDLADAFESAYQETRSVLEEFLSATAAR